MIELYFSKDNKSYIYFGKLSISLVNEHYNQKPGTQYFAIDPVDTNIYKSLKIVIKETYGGLKTYINQVYLYDEIPEIENKKSINEINYKSHRNARNDIEIKYKSQINK